MFRALCFLLFCAAACVCADDDVAKLVEEAKSVLIAHRDNPATAQEYAQCLYKLERAQALLEKTGDSTSAQAQEVNSTMFWARRFSNLEIIKEVEKLHAAGGDKVTVSRPAPAAPKPAKTDAVPEARQLSSAKSAYAAAERFAAGKAQDPYAVSLRWFQMASEFAGTDYAVKALEKAREAQSGISQGKATAYSQRASGELEEIKQDKPEYTLLAEADRLLARKDLEGALLKYKASIAARDTIPAERHMGHAYFKLAQKITEGLTPKWEALDKEYAAAYERAYEMRGGSKFFNDRSPGWVAVQKKVADLRKESDSAVAAAASAQGCFEKVLKMVPDKKDLDAAAYVGVSMARRPLAHFRARGYLKELLDSYKPSSGEEQITLEFCRSEYERLGK